jgi:hypothetical protein
VVVGAVSLVALLSMSAWVQLVVLWMVLLLFPSMAQLTSVFVLAPIFVATDELARTPIRTLVFSVLVELGFPSKILPIMSIDAYITLMLTFVIGTPDRFEMKHVKVNVAMKLVDQFNRNLRLRMCKRAVLTILALISSIDVGGAKLCLIFVRMVKFFHPIMSLLAIITIRAFLAFGSIRAHFTLVLS